MRVGLLTSYLGTDETSRKMLRSAIDSVADARVEVQHYFRGVQVQEGDDLAWMLERQNVTASFTDELEPQPVTWNYLWRQAAADKCSAFAILNADDGFTMNGLDWLADRLADGMGWTSLAYGDFLMMPQGTTGNVHPPKFGTVEDHPLPGPFALMSMDAAKQVAFEDGPYDPSFRRCADWHLYVRLANLGSFAFVPEPVGRFLYRADSLSHSNRGALTFEQQRVKAYARKVLRCHE